MEANQATKKSNLLQGWISLLLDDYVNIWHQNIVCILIAVFDDDGYQVGTIDTGFQMQQYIGVFPNRITFAEVDNGTATLLTAVSAYGSTEKIELGSIHY